MLSINDQTSFQPPKTYLPVIFNLILSEDCNMMLLCCTLGQVLKNRLNYLPFTWLNKVTQTYLELLSNWFIMGIRVTLRCMSCQ